MKPLLIHTIRSSGTASIVELRGDLTQQGELALMSLRTWSQGLGGGKQVLIFSMEAVDYISAAGLSILMRIVHMGEAGQYRTFVCGLSPAYQRLFQAMGLTQFVMLYPDVHTVLQRLKINDDPVDFQRTLSS